MGRLEGKIALITGASSGIGKATALLFAQEGARVFGVARRKGLLDEMVQEVRDAGGEADCVAADLSNPEGCQDAVDGVVEAFGGLDVLVNNAGVGWIYGQEVPGKMAALADVTVEDWDEIMAINLGSAVHCTRLAIPHLRERGGGSVVNVISMAGMFGLKDAHAYTACKGALLTLTKSLAQAHAHEGIRFNTVAPGFVDTAMIKPVIPAFDDPAVGYTLCPMSRAGTPEEMAYANLFFASDESSYCTGANLLVDGGTNARSYVS
jgi:meso-butanediol dehydrogenase / (S,S)-butanediol dehydrogenase / diacetyl reductase